MRFMSKKADRFDIGGLHDGLERMDVREGQVTRYHNMYEIWIEETAVANPNPKLATNLKL